MSARAGRFPLLRLVLADATAGRGWRDDAACLGLDTELFFPVDDRAASTEPPRRVCRGCPVRAACLADVLATEDPARRFGVVGGTTPGERRVLHRAGLAITTPEIGGDVA
ncbi:WhiB family transcriptional regulator [Pseudonocardia nematodicida]|uniref:WhiB family transcriptional regulator n=1 Tax=Pseudonocardia nematodicida TaxID=1206997 RepID=A0ABV1KAM6_9PSEU